METRQMQADAINRDPLDVPLCGVQLIEASAGTGKTYTLATLFTRLWWSSTCASVRCWR